MSATTGPVLVIGVGNHLRGDDGAGPEVARRLHGLEQAGHIRVRAHEGEGLGLLELWEGASAVVLVDTVRSGAPPGTIHRLEFTTEPVPTGAQHSTSHAVGPAEAIELGRALGALPAARHRLRRGGRTLHDRRRAERRGRAVDRFAGRRRGA